MILSRAGRSACFPPRPCGAALAAMLGFATKASIHSAALLSAVCTVAADAAVSSLASTAEGVGKGASRCLRSLLGADDDTHEDHVHFLAYAHIALAGFLSTVTTAFHEHSYWTAAALLDLSALWSVWRQHKAAHAEAAAAASVRRAAENPGNAAAHVQPPSREDMPLLLLAAAHAKAAYGAAALAGMISSAASFAYLVTLGNLSNQAPRRTPPKQHLAALKRLTGVPAEDVLAAQWSAHLHRPAHYVAVDRSQQLIVVCVRGTLQAGDACTVLDAVPQPVTLCGVSGHVHGGFLAAARNLVQPVAAALRAAAEQCPGYPLLLCGHSLGGGVAAVLAMLLQDLRHRAEAAAEAGLQLAPEQAAVVETLGRLGDMRCIGIGAAAAFCRELGMASHGFITSVLFGADCLPMFSVLGARLLIQEVHAKSRLAGLVGALLARTRTSRSSSSDAGRSTLQRCTSGASSASTGSSLHSRTNESSEIEEATECGGQPPAGGPRHLRRCSSAWSSASTASLAAFVADAASEDGSESNSTGGDRALPMFPPGRILWLLPDERDPEAKPQMVEVDQNAFERFLFTLETTTHHLPDSYTNALASLAQ